MDMWGGDYGDSISLLTGDLNERVAALKSDVQGSFIIPGSAGLVQSLLNTSLPDEINMVIHPVSFGSGKRYTSRLQPNLLSTRSYLCKDLTWRGSF
ncbi:hypothetical protein J23TS9_14480 [Paenibacillus sp. J23TS9]|uniref:dihydrofolate reductase family protein n=1 Tax=Paenibacillus sp. J23TS9 TaxID=2807193 RepID=UPI001B2A1679|nr:hypothetical protein J23TS9_14480 [Paenibacillus sp. J23TS9]